MKIIRKAERALAGYEKVAKKLKFQFFLISGM